MKSNSVTYEETACFSKLFQDYIKGKPELAPFYETFPKIAHFKKILQKRQMSQEKRQILSQVLLEEYGPLRKTDAVDFNIHSLEHPRTFTVTTGHQLNIFTGPLYFIYKIVSVINACAQLKEAYPDYHFVPVYWMATEDHDLQEINHFNLFGKQHTWETDQKGPVGRMVPHTLIDVIHELGDEDVSLFEKAYLDYGTLADSVRHYVNKLFGDKGLVVVDGDNHALKELFIPVIHGELVGGRSSALVKSSSEKLNALGYPDQAFSREINLFYMDAGLRARIVKNDDDSYSVLNSDLTFSRKEIFDLAEQEPEKFSPNVILRPVYQEMILPNLAYIGGPAEIAYWLQLKEVFENYETPFPVLMPRNFGLVVNKSVQKKIEKLGITGKDLFKPTHELKQQYLKTHGGGFNLDPEKAILTKMFDQLRKEVAEIDGSLEGFVGSQSTAIFKALDNITKRVKKAEEQKNDTIMTQIDAVKEKLFPHGSLQERHDNFLSFYLNNPGFIDVLFQRFDPFKFDFQIIREG